MNIALTHDVRAIANRVLKSAWADEKTVSNLQLNKIVYFVSVEFLRRYSRELTGAKIEAWQYGPVFRELYGQFKEFGDRPINRPARRVDFETGQHVAVEGVFDSNVAQFLDKVIKYYIDVPASILVDLSHAKGGAWDKVWNHEDELNVGMEITVDHIRKYELSVGPRLRKMQ